MKQRLGLVGLTLVALALRLHELGRFELFADEAASWWFGRLAALGELVPEVEPTPPLYYWLLGWIMRIFGESEVVMRMPSAVLGSATVPVIFMTGRALFGVRCGWISASLLALHPLHVFYSREARVYPLLLLLSVLAIDYAWRVLSDRGRASWGILALVGTLACYSHFYGLFLVAAIGLATVGLARTSAQRWKGVAAAAIPLVAFSPYLVASIPHLEQGGSAWSIGGLYELQPEEKRITRVLEMQMIGAHYSVFLRQIAAPPTPALLRTACLTAQLIALAAAVFAFRTTRLRQLGLVLCAWLPPILIPWAITHSWRPIFHIGRHDFYTIGAVLLLVGAGFSSLFGRLRRPAVAIACLAILGFGSFHRLKALSSYPIADRQRQLGEFLASNEKAGDRVIAVGVRRLVSEHYARRAGSVADFESFPRSTDSHPGWADPYELELDIPALREEARERVSQWKKIPEAAILVVVRSPYGKKGPLLSTVDAPLFDELTAAGYQPDLASSNAAVGVVTFRLRRVSMEST